MLKTKMPSYLSVNQDGGNASVDNLKDIFNRNLNCKIISMDCKSGPGSRYSTVEYNIHRALQEQR